MMKPLRVLLVEDSEDDAALLLMELRRGGYNPDHRRVDTEAGMRTALAEGPWDVIVSDYIMPRFSGLAALAVMKELGLDIPFIMVSGKAGEETAVEAMKAGAHDYIVKGNFARLVPAIEREIREAGVRLQRRLADEALKRAYEELEQKVQERTADLRAANESLTEALAHVKTLSGLLPICASCKKIRDDKGYWNQIESYIRQHSNAEFSHGICPECARRLYPEIFGAEDKNKDK